LIFYTAGGLPFRQPKQLVSCDGLLEATINVEVTDFVVDWLTLRRRSYNSQIPGPTWRIKRGDIVKIHLVRYTGPYALMITSKQDYRNMKKKLVSQITYIAELIFVYWSER